jgi:hypothetical protein
MTLKQNNLIGLILVVVGGLALLGNFGLLGGVPAIFFSVAMAAAGIYLVRYHIAKRSQLWASIVGFALLGLAFAAISGDWAGFYFLGLLGGGFASVYVLNRKHWWAVIPAGVLWTLSLVVASENIFPRWDEGALFFAGLAAIFGYLFAYERQRWAIFPAVALLMVGVLALSFTGGWVFPALLIAAGIYAMKRQPREKPVTVTPVMTSPVIPVDSSLATKSEAIVIEEPMTNETLAQRLEAEATTEETRDSSTSENNVKKDNQDNS